METNYQKALEEYCAMQLPFELCDVYAIADKYNLTDGQLFGIMFGMSGEDFA